MNKAILKDMMRLSLHIEEYLLEELPGNCARALAEKSNAIKEAAREVFEEESGASNEEKKRKVKVD